MRGFGDFWWFSFSRLGAIYRCDYSVYDRRRHHGWVWLDDIFILQKISSKKVSEKIFFGRKKVENIFEKKIEKLKMLRFWCFAYKKLTSQNFQLFNFFFEKYFSIFFFGRKIFSENFFRSNFLQNENIVQPHSSVMPAGIVHRVVAAIYCSRNREKILENQGFPHFHELFPAATNNSVDYSSNSSRFPTIIGVTPTKKNIFWSKISKIRNSTSQITCFQPMLWNLQLI